MTILYYIILQDLRSQTAGHQHVHSDKKFQDLYDEVYEKKHSKLEPVGGELVRPMTCPCHHWISRI